MPKHFSKETRRKLSESMKRQWAMRREQQAAKDRLAPFTNGAQPSLINLFAAAIHLSKDGGDKVKRAVVDCASGETIVDALEQTKREGTSLQKRIREQLTTFIKEAL